jgi:hypothetical protein
LKEQNIMATYSMTCSCGQTMTADASSRDEAVKTIQGWMTAESIAQHMKDHHKADEPIPSVEQVHGMIAQLTTA